MTCSRCEQQNPSSAKFCLACASPIDGLPVQKSYVDLEREIDRLQAEIGGLRRSLGESLEQQNATAEILRVMSGSPTDAQPVFEAIGQSVVRLMGAAMASVYEFDGTVIHLRTLTPPTWPHAEELQRQYPRPPDDRIAAGRVILERTILHLADLQTDPATPSVTRDVAERMGLKSVLWVPMLRDDTPIGVIGAVRAEAGLFPDKQIALLKTFADQAVIAIDNVRLFRELQARNTDLSESLEQQTATGEILRVISASPTDVQPVFDTVIRNAVQLCGARLGALYRFDGEQLHLVAHHNESLKPLAVLQAYPMRPDRTQASGRAVLDRTVIEIPDALNHPEYVRDMAEMAPWRSLVAVPMMRSDGSSVGAIVIQRGEAGRLDSRHLELLKTFADQAVIALENVRLFNELQARTAELTHSVGELRALGEVSQAVSSSLDLETVLATIVTRAVDLSASQGGIVYEFDEASESFQARATHGIGEEFLEAVRAAPIRLGEGVVGRVGITHEPIEISDMERGSQMVAPQVRSLVATEGVRSLLAIPLLRERRILGGIVILRRELGSFSPTVVATLQTFAAQSVLAIQNAQLFREIQRQKQYSDALVATSPVAIVTLDLDGTVAGWNPAAERLFGYASQDAIGRSIHELIATPEIRAEVLANLRENAEGARVQMITRRARKDGTLVDVEISSVPVVVNEAEVGALAIYHDITELLRARREAEGANEAKSAFLATMSHEIRTPMNAVIGMSGLLLNTALTEEQRDYAEVIRGSGDALLTVINDILDFSKIEAGKLELESQPFELRECIEGALDLVASRAADKGLDLAYLLGDGVPAAVSGDVTRLRQILLNLLSNAVKFTESGEVVVSVAAQGVAGARGRHELTFSVRDTGIGIAPERLDRLFQSFSQVDTSTSRRYGGTGLGLVISQRLCEMMGGQIRVTSEPGLGSDFRFTIRADAADGFVAPARRDLSGLQPLLQGRRVLVVDDNATNRRILTTHLSSWGMDTQATESPMQALGWVQQGERFDLAILDMHMPEMDGVALSRALRQHPAGATLPLVLFTSLGRREAVAEGEGFAAYLHKPIKPSQLFDTLVTVLPEQSGARVTHIERRRETRELDPAMAARHPLRILLAEDNAVNQKVALRLLAQLGYRADVAGNGLETIQAVERQVYDLVLMDVQMPEMDGLEASREINRRWSGERPRIVAMTANAMRGDRELCLAAGMDDYVAKPIRIEQLVAALEGSPRRVGAGTSRHPEAGAPIDVGVFEQLRSAMGDAFAAELIDTFVGDTRALIATLARTLTAADRDAFRRAAHSLKSSSDTLGARRLGDQARELEALARAGSLQGAADRLPPLTAEADLAIRTLVELRRALSA